MGVEYVWVVSESFAAVEFGGGSPARHGNWMGVGYAWLVLESFVILEFGGSPPARH